MELRRQVSNEIKLRRYVVNTALVLSLIYVFGTLVFSDMGLMHYVEIKEKRVFLSAELKNIESANEELLTSLANYKNDNYYLEKFARENFGMAGPGELIFLYNK